MSENIQYEWMWPEDRRSAKALLALSKSLKASNACALVGAGLIAPLGFPTWKQLLDELAQELPGDSSAQTRNMLARHEDFLWRAQEYRQRIGEDTYFRYLNNRFSKRPGTISAIVQNTLRLKFKHIFTTNYDKTLEHAHFQLTATEADILDWKNQNEVRRFLGELDSAPPSRKYIHLHGIYSERDSIVLTDRDYVRAYVEDDAMVQRLFVLFATQHFVFLGFSLSDPDFVQILREVNSRLGTSNEPSHYAILPARSDEDISVERGRLNGKYDVEPIFYRQDKNDHHANLDKLIEWLLYLQDEPGIPPQLLSDHVGLPSGNESVEDLERSSLGSSSDPQKGRWGGQATKPGRELSAHVTEVAREWFRVDLVVRSVPADNVPELLGSVVYHLHDSFEPPIRPVTVIQGVASLTIHAYGAFTVGVQCDDGRTTLEQDLSLIESFPAKFRNR